MTRVGSEPAVAEDFARRIARGGALSFEESLSFGDSLSFEGQTQNLLGGLARGLDPISPTAVLSGDEEVGASLAGKRSQ